jgi:hypothetical protein
MREGRSWRDISEAIGTLAVIASLIYVGLQVRQNTVAIQTATSQQVFELHRARAQVEMEDPEFAALLLRARRTPEQMTAVDSLRYDRYINLSMNLHEAIYSNVRLGTMERDMAAAWLAGLPGFVCAPGVKGYWGRFKSEYHPTFAAAVDSVITEHPVCGEVER